MPTPGTIAINTVPWPPADGCLAACEAALVAAGIQPFIALTPSGVQCSDVPTVQTVLQSYAGSATQLSYLKGVKQAALDAAFDAGFELTKFIRGGTATNITGNNVGTFISTITNNYRSLRASIAAAGTLATLNAININSGWPSNP